MGGIVCSEFPQEEEIHALFIPTEEVIVDDFETICASYRMKSHLQHVSNSKSTTGFHTPNSSIEKPKSTG